MKVMLIQPPSSFKALDGFYVFEPLGLEYLGAALKEQHHEVIIHHTCLEPDYESVFLTFQPDVVGLTGYTSQLNIVKNMAARLKQIAPHVFIIVGGHHATVSPEDYNTPHINLVVRGEGVHPLQEIMHNLQTSRSFEGIPGLGIPGAKMLLTAHRPYPCLDSLPFPDRNLLKKYRSSYFIDWLKPLASIRTSLGCFNRCNFCANWVVTEGRYLKRQPEKIVEELKSIAEEYVYFTDDESMTDWRRMDMLADLIKDAGLKKKYYLLSRVDTVLKHPELFAKWKEIGLTVVFLGLESISNKGLIELNKNITIEEQKKAVDILKDLNICVDGSFILKPSFTKIDFNQLYDYIEMLKPSNVTLSVLTPLPGTELYKKNYNNLITHKPEMYDIMSAVLPTTLPLKVFYSEYAKLMYRISLIEDYSSYTDKNELYPPQEMLESQQQFMKGILQKHLQYD